MLPRLFFVAAVAAAASCNKHKNNNNNDTTGSGSMSKPADSAQTQGPAKLIVNTPGKIAIVDFDGSKFVTKGNATATGNPTWAAFAPPNLLYAVDENGDTTSLLKLDLEKNTINPVSTAKGSTGVVHLELTKDKSRMVGAGYGSGNIDIFDTSGGGLKFSKAIASNDTVGPNKERQAKPHPHQSLLDPSGRYVAVMDLGTDNVLILNTQKDFEIVNHVPVKPGGCGPRHGAFFPAGASKAEYFIVLCEIKNLVVVYSVKYTDDKGIELEPVQTVSTFKSEADAPAKAAAGEVVLAPDNQSLYVSNRLTGGETDSIAHFRLLRKDGTLKVQFVGLTSTGGKLPRMFSASADGKYLFVGNQDGALGLVALKRGADGALAEKPVASIEMSQFPGQLAGPSFVLQIA
ncbi:carboxy-cis,cis-muconate cyclase [Metarhizium album ARSEF 1941]|uniref:Carboxy-cis,cis-muconate cyclase n=1 Tax=Metarhizium album (strain ARSEF 1941) TaxID=1081103 RepID=A0A0B2X6X3_METAS|nr:carboxy-cis,cis-muconate cyclase [Metarhizium album ARSEF 1941]KHO01220.1 carboxy-cis,cis-muconate cyclase [Metarhizium album ARSEF 1941]